MRRDVLLCALTTTCVVLVVWHASRSVWDAACHAPTLVRHTTYPTVALDEIKTDQDAADDWLQWSKQPQITVPQVEQAEARTAMTTDIERTEVLLHAAGNTVFRNLYLYDGALHIVADERTNLPELKRITSNGASLDSGKSDPTEEDIRVLDVGKAESVLGKKAIPWEGTTWMITEHPQFIAHYYHYTAEILLSLQRTTAALNLSLPPPERIVLPHSTAVAFRDGPGMNAYISLAGFPTSHLLFSHTWKDIQATKRVYKLERAVIFDRAGAMGGPAHGKSWKPISEAMSLATAELDWWAPVRERVVEFASGDEVLSAAQTRRKAVVTYVSRQRGQRRALKEEDHLALVHALEVARNELDFELNVVHLEGMSKAEQILLAARTTVLMGVHGNGLTSLVWMRPSPQSAVFEFFMPGGWFRDYEITARSLGFMYRGFWNDTSFSYPGFQGRDVEGFHSREIPIHAPHVVAQLRSALSSQLGEHILPEE